ncbi:MAG: hypothetical protein AB7O37_06395 [Vicinamibacteria bacterium]
MSGEAKPDSTNGMPLVARAILGGAVMLVAIAYFASRDFTQRDGPDLLAWIACGLSPVLVVAAVAVRGGALVGDELEDHASEAQRLAWRRRTLFFFALLDVAVIVCALSLLLVRNDWPLLVAALPLALMVVNLPRSR